LERRTLLICLLLILPVTIPFFAAPAEAPGGVEIGRADVLVANIEIDESGGSYDLNFSIAHMNGLPYIRRVDLQLETAFGSPRRVVIDRIDEDDGYQGTNYTHDGLGYEDISLKESGFDEDYAEGDFLLNIEVSFPHSHYERMKVEILERDNILSEYELPLGSTALGGAFGGQNISLISFPIVGLLTFVFVYDKSLVGEKVDDNPRGDE